MGESLKPMNLTFIPLRVHARRDGQGNGKQQGQQQGEEKGRETKHPVAHSTAPESRFIHDPAEKPHTLPPLTHEELQEILGKKLPPAE